MKAAIQLGTETIIILIIGVILLLILIVLCITGVINPGKMLAGWPGIIGINLTKLWPW